MPSDREGDAMCCKLPKPGDSVWEVVQGRNIVLRNRVTKADGDCFEASSTVGGTILFHTLDIGVNVFLSYPEAVKRQKELAH